MSDTKSRAERRAELTEQYAAGDPEVKAHLESLTEEAFMRFVQIRLQLGTGELRRVTLSDGSAVLVDGDCEHTGADLRAAVEGEQQNV